MHMMYQQAFHVMYTYFKHIILHLHSTLSYMQLPLQREARSFFDCQELQGVELENQGGSGSALSHWEQRILEVHPCMCMHLTSHAGHG